MDKLKEATISISKADVILNDCEFFATHRVEYSLMRAQALALMVIAEELQKQNESKTSN